MTRASLCGVLGLLVVVSEPGRAQLGTFLKARAEEMALAAASDTGMQPGSPLNGARWPCEMYWWPRLAGLPRGSRWAASDQPGQPQPTAQAQENRATGGANSPGMGDDMQSRLMSCAVVLAFVAAPVAAQDSMSTTGTSTEAPVEVPKKKKGFLGKLKGIVQDKTVQQVAKVAACTMVPGGQYVAGAIDAGASAAEGNAGGAAAGAAGVATGSSCFGSGPGNAAAAGMMGGSGVTAGMTNLAVGAASQAMTGFDKEEGPESGGAAPARLTPKQEKAFLKQMKKAGLSDEQAQEQLDLYRSVAESADSADQP